MGRSGVAQWLPCNNFGFPCGSHGGNSKKWVVIHGTASGGPQTGHGLATSSLFNDCKSKSVHYIVDVDGSCYQIVDEDDVAWGNDAVLGKPAPAGFLPLPGKGIYYDNYFTATVNGQPNYNFATISIENVKHSRDNSEALTAAQWDKLRQLVRDICHRNHIPMRKGNKDGGIIGHFDLYPPSRANCPGTFDWNRFLAEITIDQKITKDQAMQLAAAAGFSEFSQQVIVAIAQAESGLRPLANHINSEGDGTYGSLDRGILQFNSHRHSEVTDAQAYDPAQAFVQAWRISSNGTNFNAWNTFKNGSYRQYMPLPLGAHDVVVNGDPQIVWDGSPYIIRGAIRAKYLDIVSHGWIPPDDAPLGNEYDPSPEPLEYGVDWEPGSRRQDTQYISIGWSPSGGAKQIHVGAEYSRLRSSFISIEATVASLQAQVANLQAQVANLQAQLASLPMPPE